MVNVLKVTREIKEDGKYDALLDIVKTKLKNQDPSFDDIHELVLKDESIIVEYKDLNRWGEISSVHVNKLKINDTDSNDAKITKENINNSLSFLTHGEEYQVKQKNVIYFFWTFFIATPSIYVIDNLVRILDMYKENENSVFVSFSIVLIASVWGFMKVKNNHKKMHNRYLKTQAQTRELVKRGLKNNYFTYEEVYQL